MRKPRADIGRGKVPLGVTSVEGANDADELMDNVMIEDTEGSMQVNPHQGNHIPRGSRCSAERPDERKEAEPLPPASSAGTYQYQVPSTSLGDSLGCDTSAVGNLDLNSSTYFDLDLLDWGILDHSFLALGRDNFTPDSSSEPFSQHLVSPTTSVSPRGDEEAPSLPAGIALVQISPLEAHRACILAFLQEANQRSSRWEQWFSLGNMSLFLRSYFRFFHQHTPLLHLASFNITTCKTSLVLAMVLMGAMYTEDLESNGPEARRLCQLAETFAWASDARLGAGEPAELESIQAVYIITLLDAFYFPASRHRPRIDITRLMNEARRAGLFGRIPPGKDKNTMSWSEWSRQECRIRTAFILYLFDAARTVLFNQYPELRLYELCLPLPCDESVLNAGSEEEWRKAYDSTENLSTLDYPVILSLFLCEETIGLPLDLSVMGAFTVLHGILVHMWEHKCIHERREAVNRSGAGEQNVRDHLFAAKSRAIDKALQTWREHWARTVSRPGSMASKGLYRDRAMTYWLLGGIMNRSNDPTGLDTAIESTNGNWTLKVPRLLRKLALLTDSGQIEIAADTPASDTKQTVDEQLGRLRGVGEQASGDGGMDEIILGCMMRRERQAESWTAP
ncbi:hypothetical protein ACJZ2D_006324 [Fusarium nematophilum]